MGTGSYAGLVSIYGLKEFETKKLDVLSLFPFVSAVRLRTVLFLWMSCYTPFGFFAHTAYLLWVSLSAGILLSVFVLRQGYAGVLLFFCCLFPQWLFYLSAFLRELRFLEKKVRPEGNAAPLFGRSMRRDDLKELICMLLMTAAGAAAEVCAGLKVFQIFLQYL